MKRQQITPEMLRAMNPADAERYGGQVLPVKSPGESTVPKLERNEHRIFENWLNSHGFAYRHSRTDKPTRETCGAPDFTVYDKAGVRHNQTGICLAIEFKLPGNSLSEAQEAWAAKYGGVVHIIASADEAIKLVMQHFDW